MEAHGGNARRPSVQVLIREVAEETSDVFTRLHQRMDDRLKNGRDT